MAWSYEADLLAALVEITDSLHALTYAGWTGGKRRPGKPVKIKRPKPKGEEGVTRDRARIRQFFAPFARRPTQDDAGG